MWYDMMICISCTLLPPTSRGLCSVLPLGPLLPLLTDPFSSVSGGVRQCWGRRQRGGSCASHLLPLLHALMQKKTELPEQDEGARVYVCACVFDQCYHVPVQPVGRVRIEIIHIEAFDDRNTHSSSIKNLMFASCLHHHGFYWYSPLNKTKKYPVDDWKLSPVKYRWEQSWYLKILVEYD